MGGAAMKTVPDKRATTRHDPCSLALILVALVTPSAWTSRYETEVKTSSVLASQDGEITFPVMFGRGDHGKAVATASGKTGTVSLEYGVGMDAFKRQ